uniref:Ovule protein n=1 Tax=Schistosoma curassoni TaxID=6186 RepID=A0A183JXJ3_9TREM
TKYKRIPRNYETNESLDEDNTRFLSYKSSSSLRLSLFTKLRRPCLASSTSLSSLPTTTTLVKLSFRLKFIDPLDFCSCSICRTAA